ncbi:MAG: acyltransferase [Planctomycetota bacterium]|nr:acyltransferase [Planctomycetota bacterium]
MSNDAKKVFELPVASESMGLFRRVRRRLRSARNEFTTRRTIAFCGRRARIEKPMMVHGGRYIRLGEMTLIMRDARIEAFGLGENRVSLDIGARCIFNPGVHLAAADSVSIGDRVLFASGVYVTDHDHDVSDPSDPPIANRRLVQAPVRIDNFVWLGERVMVLKGVTIGERSIVGAGSIVTTDIPPYSMAVGAPARVVKTWNFSAGCWDSVGRD